MSHTHNAETYKAAKAEVKRVTIILTILTIIELVLGFWMYSSKESLGHSGILFIKGVILILMVVKAFYIVAYFMHLKHEMKNMIMTIVVPLSLFIWFIFAFLYDGNSYNHLRNTYDRYYESQRHIKVEDKHESSATHSTENENHTEEHH